MCVEYPFTLLLTRLRRNSFRLVMANYVTRLCLWKSFPQQTLAGSKNVHILKINICVATGHGRSLFAPFRVH